MRVFLKYFVHGCSFAERTFCRPKILYRHDLGKFKQNKSKTVCECKSNNICSLNYYLIKKRIYECDGCINEILKHLKMTGKKF